VFLLLRIQFSLPPQCSAALSKARGSTVSVPPL
jgi:hypothetical protein